jgi:riboflavin synthase
MKEGMFTGIVGSVGEVVEWRSGHLAVRSEFAPSLEVGGSVAVNGACLTVLDVEGEVFFVDVVPETRRRTNLSRLGAGDRLNLERPVRADQGLDGHLVQGHVDGTARVVAVAEVEQGREIDLQLPPGLAPLVAEKGFIALDGTSLTVTAVHDGSGTFSVAVIPYTLEHTVAGQYVPGTLVNVEVDVVARYVARLLRLRAAEAR